MASSQDVLEESLATIKACLDTVRQQTERANEAEQRAKYLEELVSIARTRAAARDAALSSLKEEMRKFLTAVEFAPPSDESACPSCGALRISPAHDYTPEPHADTCHWKRVNALLTP